MIAALLCKQNSHEISSSPIIWVSSLSLCINAGKKRRERGKKGRGGGREKGATDSGPIPCSPRICHQQCLALVPTSCSSHRASQKEQHLQSDWRQIIKGHCTPSETRENSPKGCLNENLHVLGISSRSKAPFSGNTYVILPLSPMTNQCAAT